MKIVLDLQGLQRDGNRKRGIGRYCLDLTKSLINFYPENEYILFANAGLSDLRNDFSEEFNNQKFNLTYFNCPTVGDINDIYVGKYSMLWLSIQLRSYALSVIDADVILITSFFDGFRDNSLVSLSGDYKLPPVVSIIYDLIPLIHSEQYLSTDPEYKLFYLEKIKELSSLDGLFTISKSSLEEACKYLEINPKFIYNISSACNEQKFSLQLSNPDFDRKDLGRFLLYCGATDPRKNLYRLIEAYSLLPLEIIFKHKLVLTGPYTEEEILLIKEWIINFGLSPEYVVFLGYVTDTQLAHLYSNCYLFVFPSLHEGFGLPVLEAMNCGAPVIASNLTSLPEIIGNQSFLFDPYNAKDISCLMNKCLTDNSFYQSLCKNSELRKKFFSWKNTSDKTINSLKEIVLRVNRSSKNNNHDIKSLISTQYNILRLNLLRSPLIKEKSKLNLELLKLFSSAISIINKQANKIEFIRQEKIENKYTWRIEGPFDTTYSLAILNKNYALAMYDLGQNVLLYSTEGPGDYEPDSIFLEKNKIIKNLFYKSKEVNKGLFICTRNLYPPRVHDSKGVINLLHAYGWEESMFPQSWVRNFNTYLTGMTVMSCEVKKILIDNGVNVPISVCGLGVDHIDNIDGTTSNIIDKNKFTFLHISSCFARKGIECLLAAYFQKFNAKDDVIMIIKTFRNPHNNIYKILNNLKKVYSSTPEVLILEQDLSPSEIKSLYLSSNALVAPSYGEGFNLTVAEAMRVGLPVITTGWGGQTDFCNAKNSFLVDFTFEYSNSHLGLFSSVWARPSVDHLAKLMKEVYSLSNEKRLSKIESAKESISQYTWKKVAEENLNFVKNLSNSFVDHSSKLGWISTWGTRCGIATYSEHLLSEIKSNYLIFANRINLERQDKVVRCWNIGDDNLQALFDEIISNNITSIVLQFNYGFFEFTNLSKFIRKINLKNIKIIIFLHSTKDPESDDTKKISCIKDDLSLCQRLLVHTPADLNRLKEIGLVDNVTLFPHGLLDFNVGNRVYKKSKSSKSNIHFSSYGFCLPNKGFLELIKAINILIKDGFQCRLSLYTALYDNPASVSVYNQLVDFIDNQNLKQYVTINTAFMSDKETLTKLSSTDLVVFPYQFTNESASGAVRQAISSFTPVAVTPLAIFDDVLPVVYKLPGTTPSLIAKGLKNWVINFLGKPMTDLEKEWRNQHSFEKLGYRLQGLINSLEVNC